MVRNGGTVTGYPVPMAVLRPLPPRHASITQNIQPTFDKQKCMTNTIVLLVIGFLIVLLTILFTVDSPPSNATYSVVSLAISSFNVSSFPSQLYADFDLNLSSTDTIKHVNVRYDHVAANFIYRSAGITLAQGPLPSFHHYRRNTTTSVHGRVTAAGEYLLPDVAQAITRDLAGVPRALVLDVNVTSRAYFRPRLMAGRCHLNLYCKEVAVWFNTTDAGFTLGPPKSCDIVEAWNRP